MPLTIPRITNKTITFGNPYHGLNESNVLTLSNATTIATSADTSQKRFGDCYSIRVPGNSYSDPQLFGSHLKFENYALNSGLFKKYLYNFKKQYGGETTWIFCDSSGDRWLMTVDAQMSGTYTAPTINVSATKFGDFHGAPVGYSKSCSFAQVVTSQGTANSMRSTIVNVNKSGSICIVGLQIRTYNDESLSTLIFDDTYAYPSAFLRIDITDASNPVVSVYKTAAQASEVISSTVHYNTQIPGYANTVYRRRKYYALVKTYHTIEAGNVVTWKQDIGIEFGEYAYSYLSKVGTITALPSLPANEFEFTHNTINYYISYSYTAVYESTYGLQIEKTGSYTQALNRRTIHVLIDDSDNLKDVVCVYESRTGDNWVDCIIPTFTADRLYKGSALQSGQFTIYYTSNRTLSNYSSNRFRLEVSGSTVHEDIEENKGNTEYKTMDGGYLNITATSPSINDVTTVNTVTVASFFNGSPITTSRIDAYNRYLGHMFSGHRNGIYPFIAIFTNNLVGYCHGNDSCSHASVSPFRWNTSYSGDVPYNQRYCSYEPEKLLFSGLKTYPVCYV